MSKINKATISIISASYNAEKYIKITYESIRSQEKQDWEWLVTDDCSTDATWDILQGIAVMDPRVKIAQNLVNSGAAVSRNHSLARVTGEFIAFIDSDDVWASGKLTKQLDFMGEDKDFSFTAYELINAAGEKLGVKVDANQVGSFSYKDMLQKKATLGCSTVMLRSSAFSDLTMPLIRTGQDYAFWLKLLKTGQRAYVLSEPLTQYGILPDSISRNKFKKAKRQWQIYREIEKIGLITSGICFMFYAWRAVFKK